MKKLILIVITILLIIAVSKCFEEISSPSDPNQKENINQEKAAKKAAEELETNKFGAYLTSQEFIKNQLKAPSTAKFAKTWDDGVIMNYSATSKEYTTVIWVDAQNSFGAMIRTHFKVVLKMSDDKKQWLLVSLNKLE